MNRDPLTELLRQLPREKTDGSFVAELMERLGSGHPPRRSMRRLVTAVVSSVLIFGSASGWLLHRHHEEQRLSRLRAEEAAIRLQIDELRRLTEQRDPVVYLGGYENVDLVLDLRTAARDDVHPVSRPRVTTNRFD
ncbi:MAG: hypothetical protein WBX15_15885 [Thermoanaerobaculia bacterium]